MILAGDVGGTKIHLAYFTREDGRLVKGAESIVPTESVRSLGAAIAQFRAAHPGVPAVAGFGVAGPVVKGVVHGANLPWSITEQEISLAIGGGRARLVNDLEASAHALVELGPDDLEPLQVGEPTEDGNRGLVSPGTGLGECVLLRHAGRWFPVASEGGHADFAPRNDEEVDLLRWLRARYGRASVERVVAGPGLVNVYRWLVDSGLPEDPQLAGVDDAALPPRLTSAALERTSRIARETRRVWLSVFGAEAGNVALRGLTLGGIFLGGGIPARLLPLLRESWFLDAFQDKEPHRSLLRRIPISVVRRAETPLLGAAHLAEEIA